MSIGGVARLLFNTLLRKQFPILKPGVAAPDFEALDHRGEPVRMSDFRGRYVVLWFFPKADTPG
jgi:hypothetical protein